MHSLQSILDLSVRQPILVAHQRRLRNNVISEFAFMWAIWIYNEEGSVTVRSNAQVNSNNAVGDGGAIYSTGSSAAVNVIENAQINGNVANLGGALYNVGGSTATMSDSAQMRYNAAGFGGAVWNGYAGSSFTTNDNAWLDHNTATNNGGPYITMMQRL